MTDNRTTELLPCPFCGGEADMGVNKQSTVREYFVGCMNCHIRLYKIGYKRFWSEAEAIAAWNTRMPEQAVAATLGARECEFVIEDNMNKSEGMGDVWFRCTNCDTCYDYQADDWLLKMPHCPKCGATVKAVK